MIPLAQWLAKGSDPKASSFMEDAPGEQYGAVPAPAPDGGQSPTVDTASTEAREEELAGALRACEARAAAERDASAERENALKARLGEETRHALESGIARGFEALREMIEEAVCDALRPFLRGEALNRSVAALLELIQQELRNSEEPALEIRAPEELHDQLGPVIARASVSIALAEADEIAVVFDGRRARFEQLALRWCAAIEGSPA